MKHEPLPLCFIKPFYKYSFSDRKQSLKFSFSSILQTYSTKIQLRACLAMLQNSKSLCSWYHNCSFVPLSRRYFTLVMEIEVFTY